MQQGDHAHPHETSRRDVHIPCGTRRKILRMVTEGSFQHNWELSDLEVLSLNYKASLPLWSHQSGLDNHTWQHSTDIVFVKGTAVFHFHTVQTNLGGCILCIKTRNSWIFVLQSTSYRTVTLYLHFTDNLTFSSTFMPGHSGRPVSSCLRIKSVWSQKKKTKM